MSGHYTKDKIENWVSDFCVSDGLKSFSPEVRDLAGGVLVAFLAGACDIRGIEPEDVEEADLRMALLGPVARLAIPEGARGEVPGVCGALLAFLETEGRLSDGRMLGAFVGALRGAYLEAASGKTAPAVRAGSKIGRNDACPCGSGKKYKKCCMRE